MTPVRLEPATPLSRVKHSTTRFYCTAQDLGHAISKLSNKIPNTMSQDRADPDQTASEEAVRSEFSLFAIMTIILLIPALTDNQHFI